MRPVRPARGVVIVAAFAAALIAAAPAPAAPPASCGLANPDRVFSGSFDTEVEGDYVLVRFDVPADRTRVQVHLCNDQPDLPTNALIQHTLDLGVYEPSADGFYDEEEFRGWGGSSRLRAKLTPEAFETAGGNTRSTTLGFIPGAIPAGQWAAEIGIAAVAGVDEGDTDGSVAWRLEVKSSTSAADLDNPFEPEPYDEAPAQPGPAWFKGDFHVHAEHSSPNDASMRETFDYAFGPRPGGAGLDFITLSDYVTPHHWDEIGGFQADYPGKLIVRSAEIITYRGHVNNHASVDYVDYRTGTIHELQDGQLVKVRDAQPASRLFDDVHAGGGWGQINHPTTFPSKVPAFANLCRGCSWEYADEETDWANVDAMEVQTGPAGTPDPQGNELGPNPFTPLAIEWFDRKRREGFDSLTAVGSSDSHHAGESGGTLGLTQSPIGEATTVVYAEELSERGIQDGILAGHAYIKFFNSDGPDLRLNATAPSGRQAMMGDSLAAETADFSARVIGAAPGLDPLSQPRELLVMRDGLPYLAVPVTDDDFSFSFPALLAGDYRLQLQRGSAIEALTNPITLAPRIAPDDRGKKRQRPGDHGRKHGDRRRDGAPGR